MAFEPLLTVRKRIDQLTENIPDNGHVRAALYEFLRRWPQRNGNLQGLEVLPFSGADVEDAAGVNLADEGRRVYALVAWKTDSTTLAYLHLYNDITTPFDDGADRTAIGIRGPDHTFVMVDPQGMDYQLGVSAAAQTTLGGSTAVSAGRGPSGFVITGPRTA